MLPDPQRSPRTITTAGLIHQQIAHFLVVYLQETENRKRHSFSTPPGLFPNRFVFIPDNDTDTEMSVKNSRDPTADCDVVIIRNFPVFTDYYWISVREVARNILK